MDKTITTGLLIIVSMIMALMLFNVAYPAVIEGGDAIASMGDRAEERMRSQITIIHAAGEMDGSGIWHDTNGSGQFETFLWVKNIGETRIIALDTLDVFFGPEGNFTRVPHQSDAGGSTPYWTWSLENSSDWSPTTTLQIAIHFSGTPASGRYFAKVTTPNGVSADYFLGI